MKTWKQTGGPRITCTTESKINNCSVITLNTHLDLSNIAHTYVSQQNKYSYLANQGRCNCFIDMLNSF